MLTRLIDFLKGRGTTSFFTNLTAGGADLEQTEVGISSLIDTWLMLEVVRSGGERNRIINVIKSRGMAHSNQTCEFRLTDDGVQIVDTYLGAGGVLTGTARLAREAQDESAASMRSYEIHQKQALRESRRKAFENRLAAMKEEFAAEDAQIEREIKETLLVEGRLDADRGAMATRRRAFVVSPGGRKVKKNGEEGRP